LSSYLQVKNITKTFYGVKALKDVSIDFEEGEIHVVIGENGAGKSTLMKIVAGMYQQDSGQIILQGKEVKFSNPLDAIANRISMIHQELMPIPYLTVAQNIYLGREPLNKFGLLDKKKLLVLTRELFDEIGIDIEPSVQMRELSVAQIQLVEIAKAVSFHSRFLIMDEPTSALSDKEIESLYKLIFDLKNNGVSIVFISHKLEEVFKVADKISILRDGEHIGTKSAKELNRDTLIAMMIGRDLTQVYTKYELELREPVLEVQNLTKKGQFENISFKLYKNEILGIAGLMGAGRTELVETIFGIRQADSGKILVHGKEVSIKHPEDALKNHIALIPEDRKLLGLNLKDTTGFNISLCVLKQFQKFGTLIPVRENNRIDAMIKNLNIKVHSRKTPVVSLSGGNQQKVVIAKWLMTEPDILIMDEPTRGIDIGAKTEIYKIISRLVKEGRSVIMVSSELPEVLGMSDRVLVLCEGKMTGELSKEEMNQEAIMRCATV